MYNFEKLILKILYKRLPGRGRSILEHYICKRENGYFWSKTLREVYKEYHGIEIGIGTYGCFKPSAFPMGCVFGNYTSIANNVRYLNGNHPLEYASMHPMFYNKNLGFVSDEKISRGTLSVGHDVWIGYGVTILSKCNTIGNGAVVAAGSVVTKNIEPYTIVAGVPARVIGKRFTDNIIDELEKTQWYLMEPKQLNMFSSYVNSPNVFIDKVNNYINNKGN